MTFLRLRRYYLEHQEAWKNFLNKRNAVSYKKVKEVQKKVNNLTAELKRKNPGMNNIQLLAIVSTIGNQARRPGTPMR
jgi:uncharacterized protein YaaR (DUF327 family)